MSLSDPVHRSPPEGAPHYGILAGLALAYYVTAWLGLRVAYLHPSATPVWAPTGIALAAFMVWGPRVWPAVFIPALLINLGTAGSLPTSVAIAVGNTLEGVLGAHLLHRFVPGAIRFERARAAFAFVVLAAGLSTMVSATIGVSALSIAGYAPWRDFVSIWLTWWMGDASGALIVAPLLLLWAYDPKVSWDRRTLLEAAALAGTVLVMGQLVFGGFVPSMGPALPLEFLSVPVLLWAAMRFTPREASTAILLLSGVAVRGTLLGFGPFAGRDLNQSLLLVQSFMVVSASTTLILAGVVAERRRDAAQLQHLSESDGLTGLANFRRLHEVIDREIQRSGRTGRPFAVLLMDLNDLKAINDRLGHVTGNRAICRVAEAIQRSCRAVDTGARFGGDEFAVVLPESDFSEAWAVADRIQERTAAGAEEPALSLSFGVSEYPRDGRDRDALFEHADRTLYAMKRAAHGEDTRLALLAPGTR